MARGASWGSAAGHRPVEVNSAGARGTPYSREYALIVIRSLIPAFLVLILFLVGLALFPEPEQTIYACGGVKVDGKCYGLPPRACRPGEPVDLRVCYPTSDP